jgi:hypothetical protein
MKGNPVAREINWTDSYRVTVWAHRHYIGQIPTMHLHDLTYDQVRHQCNVVESKPELLAVAQEALARMQEVTQNKATELMDVALHAAIGRIKVGRGRLPELVQAAQVASRMAGQHVGDNREIEARGKQGGTAGALVAYLPKCLLDERTDAVPQTVLGTVVAQDGVAVGTGAAPLNVAPPRNEKLENARRRILEAERLMFEPADLGDDTVGIPDKDVGIPPDAADEEQSMYEEPPAE